MYIYIYIYMYTYIYITIIYIYIYIQRERERERGHHNFIFDINGPNLTYIVYIPIKFNLIKRIVIILMLIEPRPGQ